MRESIFSGRIPLTSPNEEIPWQMKCDIVRHEDRIEIRLIDIRDLFSFYICSISSGDYYILKREQDIRVDFETFVRKIVEMFHVLSRNRLQAVFSKDGNRFLFIERNDFKNIVRLELKFVKPEEVHYKRYLSDIIYRMESDNIKLIKENSFLKEQCKTGDRELRDKIRYMEMDLKENEKKISGLYRELGNLEEKYLSKSVENDKLIKKNVEYEKELSKLSYELEKIKLRETKNEATSRTVNELSAECKRLSDRLHELEDENKQLEDEIRRTRDSSESRARENREVRSSNSKIKKELEELRERFRGMEEKTKSAKQSLKSAETRIKELEEENRSLRKKLENAQSVYHHFYNKNTENNKQESDNSTLFSSIHPDSPPR